MKAPPRDRAGQTAFRAALAALLLGCSAPATADVIVRHILITPGGLEWQKFGETDQGDVYFVDVDGLKADGSNRIYRGGIVYADSDTAIIMEEHLDCTARTIQATYLWTMDSDSHIQNQGPLTVDPVPVAALFKTKSIAAKIMGLCQRAVWPIPR